MYPFQNLLALKALISTPPFKQQEGLRTCWYSAAEGVAGKITASDGTKVLKTVECKILAGGWWWWGEQQQGG